MIAYAFDERSRRRRCCAPEGRLSYERLLRMRQSDIMMRAFMRCAERMMPRATALDAALFKIISYFRDVMLPPPRHAPRRCRFYV